MKACIGNDFAGETAMSHARLSFSVSYDALAAAGDFATDFDD